MNQSKSILSSSAIKKPGSYVTDMDTLKAEVNAEEKSKTSVTESKSNNKLVTKAAPTKKIQPEPKRKPIKKSEFAIKGKGIRSTTAPALHIPVAIETRDRLKLAAIKAGCTQQDLVAQLIENYLDENNIYI